MKKFLFSALLFLPALSFAADAVTSQTLFNGSRKTVRKFTSLSDGTGETAVQKVDISGLTGAPTSVRIMQVWYSISGPSVRVLFDHATDDTAVILSGNGYLDFRSFGGIADPGSSGGTGDIFFTTVGAVNNDTYSIILELDI